MPEKIRTAVIGVGSLGQHHARHYAAMEGSELVCVVDVSPEAKQVADKYGVELINDYRKTADRVDAVSIAVPTTMHYEIAKFFLENNKHVLLEKPMTATAAEAGSLLSIYKKKKKKKNLIFQVGHIERFNLAIKKLQEMKKVPVLIEANRLGPFTARSIDVSVILDLMIHDIDIILQIVKSKVKKIEAIGVPILTKSTDMASVRIEFANGTVANVTASRVSPKKIRKIRIFEENAYMSIDYIRQSIKIYRVKEDLPGNREISWNDMMEMDSFPLDKSEPLGAELRSFLDSINNKKEAEVTPYQAYEALKIVLEIEKQISGKNRKIKRVKY